MIEWRTVSLWGFIIDIAVIEPIYSTVSTDDCHHRHWEEIVAVASNAIRARFFPRCEEQKTETEFLNAKFCAIVEREPCVFVCLPLPLLSAWDAYTPKMYTLAITYADCMLRGLAGNCIVYLLTHIACVSLSQSAMLRCTFVVLFVHGGYKTEYNKKNPYLKWQFCKLCNGLMGIGLMQFVLCSKTYIRICDMPLLQAPLCMSCCCCAHTRPCCV